MKAAKQYSEISWKYSGRVRELAREIANRLGIDFALVPLLDHAEIRAPGLPVLAALPTIAGEKICRRRQYIGCTAQQVATTVFVEVDREFDIGRRHELGLADLAGPGAAHFRWRKIATLHDAQRIHQLGPEHLRSPAIVGQRRQRTKRGKFPDVDAVIGLQPPDRHQPLAGYAVGLFDAGEHRAIVLHHVDAAGKAGRHHAPRKLLETLTEDLLRMISGEYGPVPRPS